MFLQIKYGVPAHKLFFFFLVHVMLNNSIFKILTGFIIVGIYQCVSQINLELACSLRSEHMFMFKENEFRT